MTVVFGYDTAALCRVTPQGLRKALSDVPPACCWVLCFPDMLLCYCERVVMCYAVRVSGQAARGALGRVPQVLQPWGEAPTAD